MTGGPTDGGRPLRSDARRNRDAVLDAGAELLSRRPGATMQELADASGLARATVYRHFPAREDLVAALVARVGDEVLTMLGRATAAPGPAADALRRLAEDGVGIGRRWGFLDGLAAGPPDDELAAADRDFTAWVQRAQARGELVDADPAWISAATRALIEAAAAGVQDPAEAGRVAGDALVRLFARQP